MTELDLTKKVCGLIVAVGISRIVSSIVVKNVSIRSTVDKTLVVCGEVALVSLVSTVVRKHVDEKIDEVSFWWAENITSQGK